MLRATVAGFLHRDVEDRVADELVAVGQVGDAARRPRSDPQPQRRGGGLGTGALAQQQQRQAG
ncbi:hypothetical protein, partial [Aurantimonas coralicida]|uniref:hypothetical protein n=1 Tax=Aurantimonas coralicida TaxID=182270 RepID=UPI0023860DCC